MFVYVHKHVEARGWPWVSSLTTLHHIFLKCSHGTWSSLIGQTGWPAGVLLSLACQSWEYIALGVHTQILMLVPHTLCRWSRLPSHFSNILGTSLSIEMLEVHCYGRSLSNLRMQALGLRPIHTGQTTVLSTPEHHPKDSCLRGTCTSTLIALYSQQQGNGPSQGVHQQRNMVSIHNGTLVSHTEKLNYDICYDYILLGTCIKFSRISFLGNNENLQGNKYNWK